MKSINYKIINLSLIIIGFLFINACSEVDNKQEYTLEIYPLKVGNSWTYQVNSEPKLDSIEEYKVKIFEVVKDTIINNKTYFLLKYNDLIPEDIRINKEGGSYINNLGDYQYNDDLKFKYPCNLGDSWERKADSDFIDEKSTTIVSSINTEITVPFGTYECIKYETLWKKHFLNNDTLFLHSQEYLKPGLGTIKIITSFKINYDGEYEEDEIYELKSATIK